MIPKRVIKNYLGQVRDDHRWLKRLSHAKMDALLSELKPPPRLHPKIGLHQKVGFYLGVKYGYFAYWYDMGTGKTLLSLELLQYWWDTGQMRRALVFVISDKAFPTWERQLKQYKINVPYCALDAGASVEKWRILDHFGEGIIFLHYPGTVAMVSKRVRKTRKEMQLQLDPDLVARLLRKVDVAIYDESTKVANTRSLAHVLCRKVSKQAEFRYALAGMPFGRDPTPIWAQMYLVDQGETLGGTLGLFRAAFFEEKENPFSKNPFAKKYNFKQVMKPQLSRMLQHNSLTYEADECIDLPKLSRIVEPLRLPATTRAYYREIVEELITAKGNMRAVKNAFHRMRQLSSGYLGLKDDETGERAEIVFEENPKLDWTLDMLDVLPRNRKALIYYQYTVSGRRLHKAITKELDADAIWLWSGTKNPARELARFMDDPDVPFAVINNQLGAYSLDGLQVANYEFFFESPVSPIDRSQAERRVWRQGQERRVFLYDPIVQDTMDEKILAFHKEGKDLFRALLADPGKMFRAQRG